MRRMRAVVYDDDLEVLDFFSLYLTRRGYEVFTFPAPQVCPVYIGHSTCSRMSPCADVMITDFMMPGINGIDLLRQQKDRGCMLDVRNKAIMAGYVDNAVTEEARLLGCRLFTKPIHLGEFSLWLDSCEQRMEFLTPLTDRRLHERYPVEHEICFSLDGPSGPLEGSTINISNSGLCLKCSVPVVRGQRVRLLKDMPYASGVAEVRWTGMADGYCIAGLHCL